MKTLRFNFNFEDTYKRASLATIIEAVVTRLDSPIAAEVTQHCILCNAALNPLDQRRVDAEKVAPCCMPCLKNSLHNLLNCDIADDFKDQLEAFDGQNLISEKLAVAYEEECAYNASNRLRKRSFGRSGHCFPAVGESDTPVSSAKRARTQELIDLDKDLSDKIDRETEKLFSELDPSPGILNAPLDSAHIESQGLHREFDALTALTK